MAASPQFKVYDDRGEYRAAFKYLEDAASLVALLAEGTTIRYGHRKVLWTEGSESQSAAESYDYVAELAHKRLISA